MVSILTNTSAMAALQTLRSIDTSLSGTQQQVSTGLRVGTASDNAAYWSVATTMRSDNMATSAVSDALGLGAAKVDTAYAGLEAVIDVMGKFKAKLVAATEDGVDKAKIQTELEQYKQAVVDIAESSSFNGQNWLNTDIEDIYDDDLSKATVVSSFVRGRNNVSVGTIDFSLAKVSLFNSTGGGLLQRDQRLVETVGGIRSEYYTDDPDSLGIDHTAYYDENGSLSWMVPRESGGSAASFFFDFPDGSPLDFNTPGAEISFRITLDKEASNPQGYTGTSAQLYELPGPYYDGYVKDITITKAVVDAYEPAWGGIITTNIDFAALLTHLLSGEGASVSAKHLTRLPGSESYVHDPVKMSISTKQAHGDGSYVEISNLSSVGVSTGGLVEAFDYGERGSGMQLAFKPFIMHKNGDDEDGIDITFDFYVNSGTPRSYSFNRTYVNNVLGKDTGKVETSEEMATLLHSLLDADWPNLVIEATSDSTVMIKSNPEVDRKWGSGTKIGFDNIRVSIEPLPTINFLDIDIDNNPDMLESYIHYVDTVTERLIEGTASLGALRMRIDMQSAFNDNLMNSLSKGIGRLVDADMNEASTRLKALQTQQQLGMQSLQIANSEPETILQLFQ
jgi:Flagellin and related hook-associated proteins